jgi:asparagine synthase (glutamine-hydrolysing)
MTCAAASARRRRAWRAADPDFMGRVINLDFPIMRRFFCLGAVGDSGLMRRIADPEYLAARLGSRLAN